MKIRELKAELASHGVCAVNLLEKSELVRAVDEARAAAARKKRCGGEGVAKQDQQSEDENRSKERTRGDDVGSMSIKQLKRELEKCGISPNQFFEKRDMQEALRSAQSRSTEADATRTCGGGNEHKDQKVPSAAPNVFPSSLSESFGSTPKQRLSTTEGALDDLNSSAGGNTKRRSKEEGSQSGRQSDREVNIRVKRMPQSYFPVNTFDSGTAGGEPMGGSPGAGLAGDAVFPGTPRDTHVHHNHTRSVEADTTFVPASAERAQDQQHRPPWTQGSGKNKNVERRKYTSRNSTSYNKSPSSVANVSFEPDNRPEWLQM